jgi:carboxyl-terminal processing protease
MLDRLGDSHLSIIPGDAADEVTTESSTESSGGPEGDIGLELRLVDGRFRVTRVDANGPAARSGIHMGDAVDSIGERDLARVLRSATSLPTARARAMGLMRATMIAGGLLRGDSGASVTLRTRDQAGRSRRVTLVRRRAPGEVVKYGNLPPLLATLESERRTVNGGCVGVIRFSIWLVPIAAQLDRAIRELRDCRGIVLDLRGNPGGVGGMVMGAAGYFVDEAVPLGVMRMRTGELKFVVNPRRIDGAVPFAGPLALVVDGESASTTEIFAAGLQQLRRARVFGETTAGEALPALLTRLPNGDALLHAVADYTLADGRRVEGVGVVPDVVVPHTVATLRAGRDEPLERAVSWAAQPR